MNKYAKDEDVDLDADPGRFSYGGEPLTEARAVALGEAFASRARIGRPSLSGRPGASHAVSIRFADQTLADLDAAAKADGRSRSSLAQEAIEAYLAARVAS